MRGKLCELWYVLYHVRIIPAHAGQTVLACSVASSAADHPRACGANCELLSEHHGLRGSSPRMRGKRCHINNLHGELRIIPAHAGQTVTICTRPPNRSDHPRACGANVHERPDTAEIGGSSPRMRGKPLIEDFSSLYVRIIPAHAGQTSPRQRRLARQTGSSPRMRGKPSGNVGGAVSARIIPAHAGQTKAVSIAPANRTDHPRACGANLVENGKLIMSGGSSPRMRGKHLHEPLGDRVRRIIPAHAGQTGQGIRIPSKEEDHPRACGANMSTPPCPNCLNGSSPRMRGKPLRGTVSSLSRRIIPAHAGQTACTTTGRAWRPDHPRACGANLGNNPAHGGLHGSSPRMRGKRHRTLLAALRRRIIPAHAGQTTARRHSLA